MSPDKLIYMANQIGKFFAHQGGDKAVAGIADQHDARQPVASEQQLLIHAERLVLVAYSFDAIVFDSSGAGEIRVFLRHLFGGWKVA